MATPAQTLAPAGLAPSPVGPGPTSKKPISRKTRHRQHAQLPPADEARHCADTAADHGVQRMLAYDLSQRERVLALPRLELQLEQAIHDAVAHSIQRSPLTDHQQSQDLNQYLTELVNEALGQLRCGFLLTDDQIKRIKMAQGELPAVEQAEMAAIATNKRAIQESLLGNPPLPPLNPDAGWFDGFWAAMDSLAARQANATSMHNVL